MIRLTDLVLTYPDGDRRLTAVDHVSLEARPGTVTAITGPSGTSSGTDSSGGGPGGGQGPAAPRAGDGGSFMRKMEERWEKRAGDDPRLLQLCDGARRLYRRARQRRAVR